MLYSCANVQLSHARRPIRVFVGPRCALMLCMPSAAKVAQGDALQHGGRGFQASPRLCQIRVFFLYPPGGAYAQ